jgi:hypothetical protein
MLAERFAERADFDHGCGARRSDQNGGRVVFVKF